jgi:hypothetical protein
MDVAGSRLSARSAPWRGGRECGRAGSRTRGGGSRPAARAAVVPRGDRSWRDACDRASHSSAPTPRGGRRRRPASTLHDETSAGHRADRDSHRLAGEARKEIAERQPRRRANATGRDSPSLCPAHPGRTNVQGEKDRREILRARLTGEPILSAGSGSLPYACDSFPPLIGRSGGGYRRAQLARRGNRGHETTSSGARAAEGACYRWSVWEPVRRRRRGVPAPRRRARAQDGGGVTTP